MCQIGHGDLRAPAWQAAYRVAEQLAKQHPSGILALTVLEEVPYAPDAASRSEAADYARRVGPLLAKSAVVIEGGGFRSALVRSIITGMAVLTAKGHLRRVFDSISDAVHWLGEGDRDIGAARFVAALDQQRQQLSQRSAVA
jgi:hypothetical protein